jgi:hypothetical protein
LSGIPPYPAGEDYVAVSMVVVFPSGTDRQCVDVMLRNDSAVEANETFTITVLAVDDNVIVDNGTVTITIVDDDGEGLHSLPYPKPHTHL